MVSVKKIRELKNRYDGERIFILGNGPSISETPLEKLDTEYTLAFNNIGKVYPTTSWRPSFYYNFQGPNNRFTPKDLDVVTQNFKNETICFLSSRWSDQVESEDNIIYLKKWSLHTSPFDNMNRSEIKRTQMDHLYDFWSDHVSNFVYQYHSMYGGIQVAAYMGFDEIYFVGCDLGMEYKNPHMIFSSGLDPHRYDNNILSYIEESVEKGCFLKSSTNAIAMKVIKMNYYSNDWFLSKLLSKIFDITSTDHFTDEYVDNIVIADREANAREIKKSHLLAKRICEDKGISMYNATIGGDLEVYERVDLNSIV